jgi:hypothetical protein
METQKFYDLFKPEAETLVSALYETKTRLTEEIRTIKESLSIEESRAGALRAEIESLKADSGNQLTGQRADFEAFKEKLRGLQGDLSITDELIKTTREKVLPRKQAELDNTKTSLSHKLTVFVRSKRGMADEQIYSLLEQAFALYDDFHSAFKQIFQDFGASIGLSDESLYPGIFNFSEIKDFKSRIESERRRRTALNIPAVEMPPQNQSAPETLPQVTTLPDKSRLTRFGANADCLTEEK